MERQDPPGWLLGCCAAAVPAGGEVTAAANTHARTTGPRRAAASHPAQRHSPGTHTTAGMPLSGVCRVGGGGQPLVGGGVHCGGVDGKRNRRLAVCVAAAMGLKNPAVL